MSKLVVFDNDVRKKILSGSNKLAKLVAKTMGPKGKNVMIGKFVGAPTVTKDGVSVAREVVLSDPFENLACQLIKEAAGRTADIAGDGTTTATVLSNAILEGGMALLSGDVSPIDIREGLNVALKECKSFLDSNSKNIDSYDDIMNIASISANNDRILGKYIADAYDYAGLSGTVSAEANAMRETHVRFVEGLEMMSGYKDSRFVPKGDKAVVLENAVILCINRELTHFDDCMGLFTEIHEKNIPALVLAKDITKSALETLVANSSLGKLRVCAVKIPKDFLEDLKFEDLCLSLGTTKSLSETSLKDVKLEDLGFAAKIEVGPATTKVFESRRNNEVISEKLRIYEEALSNAISESNRSDIQKRMSFLRSRAAIVSVGYSTELELREKGDRVEDALWATRAALEEGIVSGGGTALLRCAEMLRKQNHSKYQAIFNMLAEACSKPFHQICTNANKDPALIKEKVMAKDDFYFGYDAKEDVCCNMLSGGVIDPAKVTKTALSNAVSIALLLINTEAIMAEDPEDPSDWQPKAGYRMPDPKNLNHKY
jgi:chaperonin GroEL